MTRALDKKFKGMCTFLHYGFPGGLGKAQRGSFFLGTLLLFSWAASGCHFSDISGDTGADHTGKNDPLRVLLDRAPTTLNPRMSLDSNGQRLGELIYAALTRKDINMQVQPYLAESWRVEDHGKLWRFKIRPQAQDQAGQAISAENLSACIQEYFSGKPKSVVLGAFSMVDSVHADGGDVLIRLKRPDPYLATNLTAVRYFTTSGSNRPCTEPRPGEVIIPSGAYRPKRLLYEDLAPERQLDLISLDPGKKNLQFTWALDDGTKALRLLRGDVDVLQDSISLAKTRWLAAKYSDRFNVIERSDGVNVSYLAFNLKHPDLKKYKVRKAIALAIDRQEFVHDKLLGFGTLAGSFLSPLLPESSQQKIAYDPAESERLLDQAGYPRGKDGVRLMLKFKTTSVRDGFETSQVLQEMLKKVGIDLSLEVVEPAVFFASIRKKAFDLYTSRWVGVSDGSIFYKTLSSKSPDNRVSYENRAMDELLEESEADITPERHREVMGKIQEKMVNDLPYLPLWYWNTAAVFRKDLKGLRGEDLSLSGSLEPLTHLR